MKLLIDTNIFIPLEPGRHDDLSHASDEAASLLQDALAGGHQLFLHPAIAHDIDRDKDTDRARVRRRLSKKYLLLPDPPATSPSLERILGTPRVGSNDWVDHQLIAALDANAVDLLVTEDQRLRRKAVRLRLDDRVVSLVEAHEILAGLLERAVEPPPAVQPLKAHALDGADPIWDGFREDYVGFDDWLTRCCREQRQAWRILAADGSLAGVAIIKPESDNPYQLEGRVLKLCSFKVSKRHNGFRYGELLLKAVFDHAFRNNYAWLYVTVLEKYPALIELLADFGFEKIARRAPRLDETVLAKPLIPPARAPCEGIEYNRRYGPWHFDATRSWYIVPIQPRYSDALFPETAMEPSLFAGYQPHGNAIRKAYLCNAAVRTLDTGDVLLFYRSQRDQGAMAIGVVEATLASNEPATIARTVARRTVYSLREIEALCMREVLVLLFRQVQLVKPPISAAILVQEGIVRRPPQSIMRIREEGTQWLQMKFRR